MKNNEIKQVVLGLANTSPYLAAIRRRFYSKKESLSTAERLVHPLSDPAFGWHFASAHHQAGKVLPNEIWWPPVWRAYCCLRYDAETRDSDRQCHEAIALAHPANWAKQTLVKALLCAGLTYQKVGEWCGILGEVVEVYAHLFFDFPDRRDDRGFVMKVLNPTSDLTLLGNLKPRNSALLLMNIGYRLGPEAVVKALGLTDERNGTAHPDQASGNIKRILLSTTEMKAKLGLLEAGDPGFTLFRALVVEEAKHQPNTADEDWRMGLGALSFDAGAQETLNRMIRGDAAERLKHAQAFDAQAAAEALKRVATVRENLAGSPGSKQAA